MSSLSIRLALFFGFAVAVAAAPADAAKTINAIGVKYQAAQEYSFEGDLSLSVQYGKLPPKTLEVAKVRLAIAPAGKFYLRVDPVGRRLYQVVSDGQTSWTWVPGLEKYSEEKATIRVEEDVAGASDTESDLAGLYSTFVIPILRRLTADVQAADFDGETAVTFQNRRTKWPVLRVMSIPDGGTTSTITELAIEPKTLTVGRMVYIIHTKTHGVDSSIQLNLKFTKFSLGPVEPSIFSFVAPKWAKRVNAVPIPGQTGSLWLNQPAPDFELKTLEGDKVRLADLRGHAVLLIFWDAQCKPCQRQLSDVAALRGEIDPGKLVIFGVNYGGKGEARKYASLASLPFQTLEDADEKLCRLFRVRVAPAMFLIDKQGKVVGFLSGLKAPDKLRAVLKEAGL